MKLFIWERIERATNNWHPEGAVCVVAESEEAARAAALADGAKIAPEEKPDYVADCSGPAYVGIFPDAGCC